MCNGPYILYVLYRRVNTQVSHKKTDFPFKMYGLWNERRQSGEKNVQSPRMETAFFHFRIQLRFFRRFFTLLHLDDWAWLRVLLSTSAGLCWVLFSAPKVWAIKNRTGSKNIITVKSLQLSSNQADILAKWLAHE